MLDRLTHQVHIIETNGESYRLKESRWRLKHRLHAAASVAEPNDAKPESQGRCGKLLTSRNDRFGPAKWQRGVVRRAVSRIAFRGGTRKKEAGMKLLLCALTLVGGVVLSGCAVPTGPVIGGIVTLDERGPVAVGDMKAGMKVGVAQAVGILGVAYGDASIAAAMKDANISKVHHVDSETFGVLCVYARYKTVVYGE
jgi:hypothetical protein